MRVSEEEYKQLLKRSGVKGEYPGPASKGVRQRAKPNDKEHREQVALFRMAEQGKVKYPELDLLNGSLNGVWLTKAQAGKAKGAGMRAGYPDIFLPVCRRGYAGLFIEMKVKGGRVRPEQKAWLRRLKGEGYYCTVCYSALEAWDEIVAYLEGEDG